MIRVTIWVGDFGWFWIKFVFRVANGIMVEGSLNVVVTMHYACGSKCRKLYWL